MEIQIKLDKNDWKKYQKHIENELPKSLNLWINNFWINMVSWMVVTIAFMTIFKRFSEFHGPTAISVAVFFILIFAIFKLNMFKVRKAFEPSEIGTFCGEHTFIFSDDGIVSKGAGYSAKHSWEIVKKVERANGMVLVYLDTCSAFLFPEAKLENPEQFYTDLSQYHLNSADVIKSSR